MCPLGNIPKEGEADSRTNENSPAKYEVLCDNRCASGACSQLGHGRLEVNKFCKKRQFA